VFHETFPHQAYQEPRVGKGFGALPNGRASDTKAPQLAELQASDYNASFPKHESCFRAAVGN